MGRVGNKGPMVFGLKIWEELNLWEEKQEQGQDLGFKMVLRGSQGRASNTGNRFGWILGVRYNVRGANPFSDCRHKVKSA